MNCERCGERPGQIRYTEYSAGEAQQLRICSQCAEELGFGPTPTPPTNPAGPAPGPDPDPEVEREPDAADDPPVPAPNPPVSPVPPLFGVVDIQAAMAGETPAGEADHRRCAGCGIGVADLDTLLGCPRCYDTFEESLEPLFERLHGARRHVGRLPHGRLIEPPPASADSGEGEE